MKQGAERIQDILKTYNKGLGQLVNRQIESTQERNAMTSIHHNEKSTTMLRR